jgi:hypothetical protein
MFNNNFNFSLFYKLICNYHLIIIGGYIIHGSRVPEIIAPNLARFNLRPYVSYRAPNVVSKIITADDLLLLQTNQNKM